MGVLLLAWVLFWMAEMNVETSLVGLSMTDAVVKKQMTA